MITWHLDPSVLLGLALLAASYAIGVALPRRASRGQAAAFYSGLLVLFVALESPLDTLGDRYLLSAHMTQHLLLVLVVPPLLLAGTPDWALRPVIEAPLVGPLARRLTRGPIAFAAYNVVFALAHLPVLFDLTLRDEGVHIAEHLAFIAAGVLAWWPILSPMPSLPRLSYPYQMLYLFLSTLPCSLVGALITLSGTVLYSPYAAAPRIWPVTALGDQQIAGLAMWIGGSLYYFGAFALIFFLWAQREEAEIDAPRKRRLYIVGGSSRS